MILLAPFCAYLANIFLGRWLQRRAAWVSLTLVGVSAVLSLLVFYDVISHSLSGHFDGYRDVWLTVPIGRRELFLGYQVDTLTAFMLVVVTFVGWFIQLYSVGYMDGDPRFSRYFAFLSLFKSSMLLLVLSDNLVGLYAAWELVGLCSYLLIGFWYEKPEAARAANKAFIVTRCGDAGFAIGIFLTFNLTRSLSFAEIFQAAQTLSPEQAHLLTLAAVLLFFGAIGKSAQFPLHIWLPDAMEGPTPVSALIHAATMVAAGVYMVGRLYPLFALPGVEASSSLQFVAWIGAVTAFLSATIALAQDDIKRVLAYSTISQLGYMLLGLGVGGFSAGLFHLVTHAFFKALLFLGSGSVIHAIGTNNMKQMGGLKDAMPWTFWTYLIGMAALAGVPPFSGFWSKDEILAAAYHANKAIFLIGLFTAFLTAFYMTRQVGLVFYGRSRNPHAHPHESPPVMLIPLVVLAAGSVLLGFIGTPWANLFGKLVHFEGAQHHPFTLVPMVLSVAAGLLGIAAGWNLYITNPIRTPADEPLRDRLGPLFSFLANKWYLDWYDPHPPQPGFYITRVFIRTAVAQRWVDVHIVDGLVNLVGYVTAFVLAKLHRFFDQFVVDGLVNLTAWLTGRIGNGVRKAQTGLVQHYMFIVVTGLALIALWTLMKQMSGSE